MNILLLTDLFPYPVNHGETVVSYNWARELVEKGHDVKLLALRSPDSSADAAVLEDMGIDVIPAGGVYRSNRFPLRWLTTRLPMSVLRVSLEELLPDVRRIVDQYAIDVIVLIGAALAALQTVSELAAPVVFVPIDSISLNLRRRREYIKSLPRKAYTGVEIAKWEYVEAAYCVHATSCIVVTDSDAKNLCKKWPEPARERIEVIPNGVDTTYFMPDPAIAEVARRLVFTGVMSTAQSVISLEWFLTNVFPLLKNSWGDLSMDIVGRDPAEQLFELAAKHENVSVVGEVPDLRPYIAQAEVYVAPMIIGSGVKNRVLEAMAMGKAVVATAHAASGIDSGQGDPPLLIAAEEAPQFAQTISELIADSELRHSLGFLARQYVVEEHSWLAVGNVLDGILKNKVVKQGEVQS